MQIKTTLRFILPHSKFPKLIKEMIVNFGENVKKKERLIVASTNWYSHYRIGVEVPQNLKVDLPQYSIKSLLLLCMY